VTIASGWGINDLIRAAYGQLSTKYRPGDQIYLFGFSRGAYAVRSLAGMIGGLGLLRQRAATERQIKFAFRLYERGQADEITRQFCYACCHVGTEIEMIGVWDTVKALGLPFPLLTYLAPMATEFHNDRIGRPVKFGYQALAMDENRQAFRPELWQAEDNWPGHMQQVWFRGAHSDIGGQIWPYEQARPLSNIPLVWMLERIERCGLRLPADWQARFPCDVEAPMVGTTRGIARLFWHRKKRTIGRFANEYIHASVLQHAQAAQTPLPPDLASLPVAS
jgi:uncharacterized protein (DUF2235 family)